MSRLALLAVTLAVLARPTPWPGGRAPAAAAIDAQVEEALRLAHRELSEEIARTHDPREAIESASIQQSLVDTANLPIDVIFLFGDSFFSHNVEPLGGLGGLIPGDKIARVHRGRSGGIDTFSCMGCHAVGGLDGAGTFGQSARLRGDGVHLSTTVTRNPPALPGVGLLQALAAEMSADLAEVRARAIREAAQGWRDAPPGPRTLRLVSKGVDFGVVTATPDGRIDDSGVTGVDLDLVVRPFGWKGEEASLRRMIEEASRVHFGAQSILLEQAYRTQPDPETLGPGPDWWDPDADGVLREIEEGSITLAALYLALLEVPVIEPPADPTLLARWSRGSAAMATLGCESCHQRTMQLHNRVWTERPETTDGPGVSVHLLVDGDQPKGNDLVALFSDLKRHAMGPELADPAPGRLPADTFLTRPLWGAADTGPWMHDGRAATLREAIEAHGGDATDARDAFLSAPPADQGDLLLFLTSLTRVARLRVAR